MAMAAAQNPVMLGLKQHNSQIGQGFIHNLPSSRSRWSPELCRNRSFTRVSVRCSSDKELQLTMAAIVNNDTDCVAEDSSASLCERGVQEKELSVSTILVNFSNSFDPYGALSTPLYQTATFKQPSATENGPYDYTRSGNPTRDSLEDLLAKLEGADRAFCFTSGMAALSAVTHLVKAANVEEVAAAVGPLTRVVWLESPTNPRQRISDIRTISEIAHAHGALVLVDNSIMSPVLSRPLELGADIVMHSATKFISGHSDVMAGVLAVKGKSLAKDIYFLQNAEGSGLAPFDCWLCLRGIKTMALRIEKQQENAKKIAEFLSSHPLIEKVYYAGLPGHLGHNLHFSQAKGGGSVLSFQTGSLVLSKHIVENTKLFSITVSFGSVKSLISLPCFMSHASIPSEVRESRGLSEDLIRLSVGIEDAEDLIADLDQAIKSACLMAAD